MSPTSSAARSSSSELGVLVPARSRNRRTAALASISERLASDGQRCESVGQLVHDPQWFPARREHVETWEPSEEILDELGRRRHHMLAVVEHEQQVTVRQPSGQRLHVRFAAGSLQPDLRGHLAGDDVR